MSHENENPLIIDVVGEVESPDPSGQQGPKSADRVGGKKGFFKKERQAAGPIGSQAPAEPVATGANPGMGAASSMPNAQPVVPQGAAAQAVSGQPPVQQPMPVQQPQADGPQAQVPLQQPQQPTSGQPMGADQSQVVQNPQMQAMPASVQPGMPAASSYVQQGNMAAVVAPQRSRAVYVFIILAVLVVLLALVAGGLYAFFQTESRTLLAPTVQTDLGSDEVRPVGSVSLDQASKVSLRATAENWNEETSTPIIAYIKRVEEPTSKKDGKSSAATAKKSSDDDSDDERYFAFAPNKNASVSLPAGRYTFSFIAPLNADGSMYSVPDMVNMVVGDGGMAVLPVDLKLIPKDEVTQEQVTRALAQLKTASEKGGESFEYEPFERSIDLALTVWFPQGDTTTEQPATDLTREQQESLNAQADSQTQPAPSTNNGGTSAPATEQHTHDWVAQHEQRWEPAIVPVIDTPAWESPVYARYRCQEGILFETLDACLTHVRERGNEPYAESNEIIRIDYHPAVVHYEEQGRYVDVVTGYRCSVCGATGTL